MDETQEKVRQFIKNYYKDKEINNSILIGINSIKLLINNNEIYLKDLLIFTTPYLNNCKMIERFYNVLNDIYDIKLCPICNMPVKFYNFKKGYNNTCSLICARKNPKEKEKRKQTCIDKYGVVNTFQVDEFKNKSKQTILDRYGVDNISQSEEIKEKKKQTCLENHGVEIPLQSNIIKEKTKKTCIEKYGTENPFQNKIVQEKYKQTSISKFNVNHPSQSKEVQEKRKQTCLTKYGVGNPMQYININYKAFETNRFTLFNKLLNNKQRLNNCIPLFNLDEFKQNNINSNYKWKWKCNICDTIFYDNLDNGASPICPNCYKQNRSNLQKEIYEFIYNYTNNILINDRMTGIEIDLLLKDYNIGIEVNGNYWHSDLRGKGKYYHLNKTIETGKLGITLIHIFEDDWLYKKDIVKNIILDKLGLITNNVDNLSIYQIKNDYAAEFLNNNCILGNINTQNSIKHYGLCTQEDIYYLISVDLDNSKIIKYCSKLNYKIDSKDISKLITHICQENNLDNLIIQCDLRYDFGDLFKSIGFNYLKFKHPTYDYINKKNFLIRINKEELIFETYDENLSIWYNALNNNYDRIWNCGHIIYEYKL